MVRVFMPILVASLLIWPAAALAARIRHAHSAAAPAVSAADSGPALLGTFRDWAAYTRGTGDGKVCYALSEPKSKEPATAKRDPIFFLINDWPGRRAKAEPEIMPGYQYRDGSTATVQVGADKFTFFTKNQDNAGGAWVVNAADEGRLIAAMRTGGIVMVTGTSKRGTVTRDSYSLAGMAEAVDKIHQACGM